MSQIGSEEVVEHLFKILVVGDIGTGKTSIIKRFVHNIFSMQYKSTIGVEFALKVINWDQKTEIRLQLWDIAGQERFGTMTRVYYKDAVGAFVVFDVSRLGTYEAAAKWKSDIDSKVTVGIENKSIPVVLLANKCDLIKDGSWGKSKSEVDRYCQENNFAGWFETSAKDNIGIEKAAKSLVQKILENKFTQKESPTGIVKPGQPIPPKKEAGCCN